MKKRSARTFDQYSLFRITFQTSITHCLAEDGFKVFHECACPFISVLNMELYIMEKKFVLPNSIL